MLCSVQKGLLVVNYASLAFFKFALSKVKLYDLLISCPLSSDLSLAHHFSDKIKEGGCSASDSMKQTFITSAAATKSLKPHKATWLHNMGCAPFGTKMLSSLHNANKLMEFSIYEGDNLPQYINQNEAAEGGLHKWAESQSH